MTTVASLVNLLHSTPSPVTLLKHIGNHVVPLYSIEAMASIGPGHFHPPPFSEDELRVLEEYRTARDPPVADEVFHNIFIGEML